MDLEPFERLSDRVAFWQGDLSRHEQTNVGVVSAGGSAVVIDANFAAPARRILASLEAQGDVSVKHVVNTHYHADHTLGNVVYVHAGASVVGASGQRLELLAKGKQDAMDQTGEEPSELYPTMLEFNDSLVFCEHDLHLIAVGPAHSGADLVAWLPGDEILFVGDLAVNWDHGSNFSDVDADIANWIAALDRCLDLRPRLVVPAHGALAGAELLDQQRRFMVDLWEAALAAADGGSPADSITSDSAVEHFVAKHAAQAVDPSRFREMASSMLVAARRRDGQAR
jgi:cyclase